MKFCAPRRCVRLLVRSSHVGGNISFKSFFVPENPGKLPFVRRRKYAEDWVALPVNPAAGERSRTVPFSPSGLEDLQHVRHVLRLHEGEEESTFQVTLPVSCVPYSRRLLPSVCVRVTGGGTSCLRLTRALHTNRGSWPRQLLTPLPWSFPAGDTTLSSTIVSQRRWKPWRFPRLYLHFLTACGHTCCSGCR